MTINANTNANDAKGLNVKAKVFSFNLHTMNAVIKLKTNPPKPIETPHSSIENVCIVYERTRVFLSAPTARRVPILCLLFLMLEVIVLFITDIAIVNTNTITAVIIMVNFPNPAAA